MLKKFKKNDMAYKNNHMLIVLVKPITSFIKFLF